MFAEPISVALLLTVFMGPGIPISIPPRAEDPAMVQFAPAECLYLTTWAGMQTPDANSNNRTEQLVAEPQVQKMVTELEARMKQFAALAQNDGSIVLMCEVVPVLVKAMAARPTTLYLSELTALQPRGGLVVKIGDDEEEFQRAITVLKSQIPFDFQEVKIGESKFERVQPNPQFSAVSFGFHQDYFVVCVGDGELEALFERWKTPTPAWITDLQKQHPLPRRATLTYSKLDKLVDAAAAITTIDAKMRNVFEAVGASNLDSYVAVTGLDEEGYISKATLNLKGDPTGVFAVLNSPTTTKRSMSRVPADATLALSFRVDAESVLDIFSASLGLIDPNMVREFQMELAQSEEATGIVVRELLASIGETWHAYAVPDDGGIVSGWTFTVDVKDREKLEEINQRLLALVPPAGPAPVVSITKFGEHTIHTFNVPDDDFFVAPSWTITDEELIFCLFPQALRSHLSRDPNAEVVRNRPEIAEFVADDEPVAVLYHDARTIIRIAYPFLQMGLQALSGDLRRDGLNIDSSILPSTRVVSKHLRPGAVGVYRIDGGLRFETRQSLPSGVLAVGAPVILAVSLPPMAQAQANARQARAMNNLRQIGLSMHNYHDAMRGLPPSATVGSDGKPLLSWRVHVLPYLGHQALYQQFHLDEPWNSEHNRKLIMRMPEVFKAPGSQSGPGKTNYLGNASEKGILRQADGPDKKTAYGFQDITDGTSNTIMAVEASDEFAVIWTKPDDFKPDPAKPRAGLIGIRGNQFFVLMCDGSVRALSQTMDVEVFKALLTRNGGELVPNF